MCGRFHLSSSPNQILGHYGLDLFALGDDPVPSGEIFPGTNPLVVADCGGQPDIQPMFWGFRPIQVRGRRKQPINARAENLFASNYWRPSAQTRRCLIPVNNWDEWQPKDGGGKQRWRMAPDMDTDLFSLGGVYVHFKGEDEVQTVGFAIITQPASQALRSIHDRQPLIVMPQDYDAWLDGQTPDSEIQRFVRKQGVTYRTQRV